VIGKLLKPEIQEMIETGNLKDLRHALEVWTPPELADLLEELPAEDRVVVFRLLPRELATETFEYLESDVQQQLIEDLASERERLASLLNDLSPDDRTALFEELPGPVAQRLLTILSPAEREVTLRLLGYPEDSIGRLMTPDYLAVREDWTVQQVLDYIRRYGRESETLNVVYVVDSAGKLVDDLRIRDILLADPNTPVSELMDGHVVSLKATDDEEAAVQVFSEYDLVALPVTDSQGILLGIVTVDDVLDVAEEAATEDMQKLAAVEALEEPYMDTPLRTLVRKRVRWLIILLVCEMFTAAVIAHYEKELNKVTFLAFFIPLILSSGGNSGSQAATLVIRAMAVGEIELNDWWKVLRRELLSGLSLGAILGVIGVALVGVREIMAGGDGGHFWHLVGSTIGLSLVGVVSLGTLAGSMFPFILKRLGADPAASSTPFVATFLDVAGLATYFTVATLILRGTML